MNLPAFCIKRPAFTIVISLVLVLVGALAYINLPIRWVPQVNPPSVSIMTMYAGASGRLVEHDVTKNIEDSLSGISGIESIESVSRMGSSEVDVTFKLGTNMDAAVEDIRSHLEVVQGELPRDATPPAIVKTNPNDSPILYLSFNDSKRSAQALSDYVENTVLPSFETLDGVGSVQMIGQRVSALRVSLSPDKMASARITTDDVVQLIQNQNVAVASGQIRTPDRFYSVYTNATLTTPEQFNNLILRDDQNQVTRLKDVGEAALLPESQDDAFRVNGQPALALGIIPTNNANPLVVERLVKDKLAEIERALPQGMHADILYDQTDYVRASLHSVYESFLEAMIFVWLVIFVFLGSFRATLIPMITIPVCVIATFSVLTYFGFSINTITLMAFVLAIGLVVDDAIVMLENINRYREQGMPAYQAALKGSREMIFPIIAMTLTLAAVYAPIAFTPGLLGVLFKEFTFTLAGAVIISGWVALTLTPMMCARWLKPHDTSMRYQDWFNRFFESLQARYLILLKWVMNRRRVILIAMAAIIALGAWMAHEMPSELAPAEEMNEIDVYMGGPRSSSFQYTDQYAREMEAVYASTPDIQSYFSLVGLPAPSRAYQMLTLKPVASRSQSTDALVASLTQKLSTITGVRVNVVTPMPALSQLVSGDDGDRLGLVLTTTGDYQALQQVTQKIMAELRKNPGFTHVENRLKWDSEQFQLDIDRDRAADLKVSIPTITNTLSTMLAGRYVGKMNDANIIVQMNTDGLANPNIIQQLYVRNTMNDIVPLSQVVSMSTVSSPELFLHEGRMRSDVIYVSLAPDFKLASAIQVMEAVAKANSPDTMSFSFTGEAKNYLESAGKTLMTFGLALIFIYLVLVAQFESFIDPLIILFTVPLAVVGALVVLWAFGGTLNIYSNIGLITLIGLIAKHGILMTDFANHARLAGKSIEEAALQAASLRLRPILMTTAAMVLGAIPLAFAVGAGAETREQVGLVIVGGLLFGTFFSLIVIPIMYTYLSPYRRLNAESTE